MNKIFLVILASLALTACGNDATIDYSEIQAHTSQCDKNDGVKSFGLINSDQDNGIKVSIAEVECNDGAVFSYDWGEETHWIKV